MSQPSNAARRAAQALEQRFDVIGESYSSGMGEGLRPATISQIAAIIDRETGIAEATGLIAALVEHIEWRASISGTLGTFKPLYETARAFLDKSNQ